MATLYFYTYNNYYNRKVKKEGSISDYGTPIYTETGTNLNFNPNDGVNALYVAGRAGNPYNGKADYILYSENNTSITSRWFIIEQTRTLKNQYKCQLRRDVLVDYYDQTLSADVFVEKAILPDSNPLIYNDEGITVNQIKTSQTQLYDDTGCGWLVGYVDRKYNRENEAEIGITSNVVVDETYDTLSSYPYYNYINNYALNQKDEEVFVYAQVYTLSTTINTIFRSETGNNSRVFRTSDASSTPPFTIDMSASGYNVANGKSAYCTHLTNNFPWSSYNTNKMIYITDPSSTVQYRNVLKEDGKILSINGKTYKVSVTQDNNYIKTYPITSGLLYTNISNVLTDSSFVTRGTPQISISRTYQAAKIVLTEVFKSEYKLTISKNRYTLRDAPYDMFCIPTDKRIKVADVDVTLNKDLVLTFGQGIAQSLGTNCYDIQLLPYCPVTGYTIENETMVFNDTSAGRFTEIKDSQGVTKGVMIWAVASSFSKQILHSISLDNIKIDNQCDVYRLCSPNYNGQFEFNAAKNGGVDSFVVDATYLPYQPFIRVAPNFSGLYGNEYKDVRGLICGGNFSITQISDAWTNYVNSNKNYNNIFDREIQNMDTKHKYERVQNIVGGTVGAISQGLTTGSVMGPVAGIAAGAASAIGGAVDIGINEALYSEAVDYKRDMFGYQLDNIRAMPNSIAKTTGYNQINTIVPTLEYYTCTEEEKAAVANKIAWNGMTVMAIGTISPYIDNTWSYGNIESKGYIKGRLIRIENVTDDFHLTNAIADELYKGAYYDTRTN